MAFPTTGILDDFNRANEGPYMTDWSWMYLEGVLGDFRIVSQKAVPNNFAANIAVNYFTPSTYGPDVEAFVTLDSGVESGQFILYYNLQQPQTTGFDGYLLVIDFTANEFFIASVTDGAVDESVGTAITGTTPQMGDSFGIQYVGGMHNIWHKPAAGVWTLLGSKGPHTQYQTAGYIAIGAYNTLTVNLTVDDFGGGTYIPPINTYTQAIAWGTLNTYGRDFAGDILNTHTKDTAWGTLNTYGRDFAWDILNTYTKDTAWGTLNTYGRDFAWRIGILIVSGLGDTFFNTDPTGDSMGSDIFQNVRGGDVWFDVSTHVPQSTSWDILNTFIKNTSWDILNTYEQDTAWDILNTFTQAIAWDILNTYERATAWDILNTFVENTAWDILNTYTKDTSWDILNDRQQATAWSVFARVLYFIQQFFVKAICFDFHINEPIQFNSEIMEPLEWTFYPTGTITDTIYLQGEVFDTIHIASPTTFNFQIKEPIQFTLNVSQVLKGDSVEYPPA
jgi:hypothetical protein